MYLRWLVFTCIVGYVVTESLYYVDSESDPTFDELPCSVIGGTCRQKGKCPAGTRITTNGLCPYQEHRGIQCCHSSKGKVVANPTCQSRGGECMAAGTRCPENLTVRRITDCKPEETCCVLV